MSTTAGWTDTAVTPSHGLDLWSTVLHEFGHVVGLDHSTTAGSVMKAAIAPGQQTRVLSDDDLAGVRALYPDPSALAVAVAKPNTIPDANADASPAAQPPPARRANRPRAVAPRCPLARSKIDNPFLGRAHRTWYNRGERPSRAGRARSRINTETREYSMLRRSRIAGVVLRWRSSPPLACRSRCLPQSIGTTTATVAPPPGAPSHDEETDALAFPDCNLLAQSPIDIRGFTRRAAPESSRPTSPRRCPCSTTDTRCRSTTRLEARQRLRARNTTSSSSISTRPANTSATAN